MSSELKQAEQIVDLLKPDEKEQLKRYIDLSSKREMPEDDASEAWRAYRQIGRQLADIPRNGISSTDLVSEMRR